MLSKKDLDYFKNELSRQKYFWERMGGQPDFKNKTILDFGCGHGAMCLDIAKYRPKKIIGIDLEKSNINFANENLEKNFPYYKNLVEFKLIDINSWNTLNKFDYIVSKETFEHTLNLDSVLKSMDKILESNGKIYSGFGPLYNFFNGDHGLTKAIFPWFHLIIPSSILIKRINTKQLKQINSIQELGLNMYSLKNYTDIFEKSNFQIEMLKKNCSTNPLTVIFKILSRIKFLEEFCTFNIFLILKKK